MIDDETIGWYHQLNWREFEQALGDDEGQGILGMLQSMGSQRAGHDLVTEQTKSLQDHKTDQKFLFSEFKFTFRFEELT